MYAVMKQKGITIILLFMMLFTLLEQFPGATSFRPYYDGRLERQVHNQQVQHEVLLSQVVDDQDVFYFEAMQKETFWRMLSKRLTGNEWMKKVISKIAMLWLVLAMIYCLMVIPCLKRSRLLQRGYTFRRSNEFIIRFIEQSDGKKALSIF